MTASFRPPTRLERAELALELIEEYQKRKWWQPKKHLLISARIHLYIATYDK